MLDSLNRLYAHLAWANAHTLSSLHTTDVPNARSLFAHLLGSEHTWLARIDGITPGIAIWPTLSLEECQIISDENLRRFSTLLEKSDTTTLARTIPYTNSAGQSFVSTVSDMLLHVALHGAYHRGQIASLIRQAGGVPTPTDFIVFSRYANGTATDVTPNRITP